MKETNKDLLRIALPAMAEQLLQMAMGVVDSYLVAFLGLVAVSGVFLATGIVAVYQALFIALATAISARVAGLKNADKGELASVIGSALWMTGGIGLVLGVFSILSNDWVFALLGAEQSVGAAGAAYFLVVGGGSLLLGWMSSLGAIVRSLGRPRYPMYISLLSNCVNLIGSAASIFLWDWGIGGVAAATVFSRGLGCLLLWLALPVSPRLERPWLDRALLRLSLPTVGERLLMRTGDMLLLSLLTGLGTEVVAGHAIGESLTQFTYLPAVGLSTATVIVSASYQGRGQLVEQVRRLSLVLSICCMGVLSILLFLTGDHLIGLFTQEPLATAASRTVLLCSLIGVPATAGTLVYTGLWQGLGKPSLPFYATLIGMWGIRIGLSALLLQWTSLGLLAIWLATIGDNLFRMVFLAYQEKKRKRKRRR